MFDLHLCQQAPVPDQDDPFEPEALLELHHRPGTVFGSVVWPGDAWTATGSPGTLSTAYTSCVLARLRSRLYPTRINGQVRPS